MTRLFFILVILSLFTAGILNAEIKKSSYVMNIGKNVSAKVYKVRTSKDEWLKSSDTLKYKHSGSKKIYVSIDSAKSTFHNCILVNHYRIFSNGKDRSIDGHTIRAIDNSKPFSYELVYIITFP